MSTRCWPVSAMRRRAWSALYSSRAVGWPTWYLMIHGLQPLQQTRWMIRGHHMLEDVARNCNETSGSVLNVRTHAGFSGQHTMRACFSLRRMRAPKISEGLSKHSPVRGMGKHGEVCDGVFLEVRNPSDRGGTRKAPSADAEGNIGFLTHVTLITVKPAVIM